MISWLPGTQTPYEAPIHFPLKWLFMKANRNRFQACFGHISYGCLGCIAKRKVNYMVTLPWKVAMGLVLVAASALMGIVHAVVFEDPKTLVFYLALDVVFVPVQVLLVTLIIERLLNEREKRSLMRKMNMVVGAFFCELGHDMLSEMRGVCVNFGELQSHLSIKGNWDRNAFESALRWLGEFECRLDGGAVQLGRLKAFLLTKRRFVLGLLQNPILLEHESFTDLLWAVCHLTEELDAREDIDHLPPSDLRHLEGDMVRAFGCLLREWLSYMQHLKGDYPYMYSLSVRTNPFSPKASPIVES